LRPTRPPHTKLSIRSTHTTC